MIRKIVITGGPCAGKTTGMSWIQNTFERMGYTLLFLQEPATEMKTAGITPARCSSMMAYQLFQMRLQLGKERIFEEAARDIERKMACAASASPEILRGCARSAEDGGAENAQRKEAAEALPAASADGPKLLIVCDRGFFDNRAYMTREEFDEALRLLGTTQEEQMGRYDAVFHLETTAKNAAVYYGTQTNAIRDEDPAEAAALDDRVIAAWERHPHFRIIENLNGFEDKMRHLVAEIAAYLGEPVPFENRRRFLIEVPDVSALEALPGCHGERIEQVYLHASPDEEIRIRRRVSESGEVFYLTRLRLHGTRRRLEAEGRLSEREYQQFLANADPACAPIRKRRFCLTWEGQYYEVDLYPFWTDRALLEVSLREGGGDVRIPPFLHVLREVTGEEAYEVSSLARTVTLERLVNA